MGSFYQLWVSQPPQLGKSLSFLSCLERHLLQKDFASLQLSSQQGCTEEPHHSTGQGVYLHCSRWDLVVGSQCWKGQRDLSPAAACQVPGEPRVRGPRIGLHWWCSRSCWKPGREMVEDPPSCGGRVNRAFFVLAREIFCCSSTQNNLLTPPWPLCTSYLITGRIKNYLTLSCSFLIPRMYNGELGGDAAWTDSPWIWTKFAACWFILITAKRLPLGAGPWEITAQLRQRTEQRWSTHVLQCLPPVYDTTMKHFGMDSIVFPKEAKALRWLRCCFPPLTYS